MQAPAPHQGLFRAAALDERARWGDEGDVLRTDKRAVKWAYRILGIVANRDPDIDESVYGYGDEVVASRAPARLNL